MVKFRTEFPEFVLPKLNYEQPILLAGSCFAELIEERLQRGGFLTSPPSHGILYHPFSLATMLHSWCEMPSNWPVLEEYNHRWMSLDHHGNFSGSNKFQAAEKMEEARSQCARALVQAQFLFLSLGTAHYFEDIASGKPVANCHKLPASRFVRKRAGVDEIRTSLQNAFDAIWNVNSNVNIILSVSPVKHLRDGLSENALSKSILNVAAHELCTQNSQVHCFPAFEILTEDLRDYRFYTEDLAHPSKFAQDYIFTYFYSASFSTETKQIFRQIMALRDLERHLPMSSPNEHLQAIENLKERLMSDYPFLKGRL